ncbi:hypothetical protein, partial [Leadbetterella byssophila]|uniref:hypothetical protein n=1 Tax=Leadbetterella byssophila TaxID=316068 RepID=UPI00399FE155
MKIRIITQVLKRKCEAKSKKNLGFKIKNEGAFMRHPLFFALLYSAIHPLSISSIKLDHLTIEGTIPTFCK